MSDKKITDGEQAALQRFANAHGRRWKSTLSDVYWYNARLWTGGEEIDGSMLHGLRNRLGPEWLHSSCKIKPAR